MILLTIVIVPFVTVAALWLPSPTALRTVRDRPIGGEESEVELESIVWARVGGTR